MFMERHPVEVAEELHWMSGDERDIAGVETLADGYLPFFAQASRRVIKVEVTSLTPGTGRNA
jgi:hypothetical protein